MRAHDVFAKFPSPGSDSNQVNVRGVPTAVAAFKKALEPILKELEAKKAEFALQNFRVELTIDPSLHQRLIGKGGAAINKFREKNNVQVDFPDRKKTKNDEEAAKKVVIIGVQEKAEAAAKQMMAEV